MKDKVKEIKKKVEKTEKKTSVLILEKGIDGFINYGADSLAGDMVNQIIPLWESLSQIMVASISTKSLSVRSFIWSMVTAMP